MRVLVEPENAIGGQAVVLSGEVCRVGRSAPAEFICADDSFLSRLHFAIDCSGPECRVRDLAGRNGTFLNGARVDEAVVHDGDRVSAGKTHFRIRIEEVQSAAPGLRSLAPQQLQSPQRSVWEILRKQPEPLFALLDAARDDRVLDLLRNSNARYQSLYEGPQGRELDNWAPHLVQLPKDSTLLLYLLHEGWGKSWGVYLTCDKPFAEVRKHFRHFLMVEGEGGNRLYFRFYDPRVLRVFLSKCTYEEADAFCGPVGSYLVEGEQASTLLQMGRRDQGGPRSTSVLALAQS